MIIEELYDYLPSEVKGVLVLLDDELMDARESELERNLKRSVRDIAFLIKVRLWELFNELRYNGETREISLKELAGDLVSVSRLKRWIVENRIFVAYLVKPPISYNEQLKTLLKRYSLRVYEEILEKPAVKYDKNGNQVADVPLLKLKAEVVKSIENRLLGVPTQVQKIDMNVNSNGETKKITYQQNKQIDENTIDIEELDKKIIEIAKKLEYKEN